MGGNPQIPLAILDAIPPAPDIHYGYTLSQLDKPDALHPVRFVCSLGGQHFVIPAADIERYRKTSGDVVAVDPDSLVARVE